MLVYIFKAILITSLIGTAATLLLTIMRPITRKTFSSGWHYYMWLVVLVSMILPIRISIPEQTPVVPNSEMVGVAQNETIIYNPIQMGEQETFVDVREEVHANSKIDAISEYAQGKVYGLAFVWFIGMILTFVYKIIGYILFLFNLRRRSSIISCPELLKYTDKAITTRTSEEISSPLMISEFISQKLNKEFINKSPDIFKILAENMETNYPISNLMNDIKLLDKMKSNIEFRIIDGTLNADETGIVFYDIKSGEVVSAVNEPTLVPNSETSSPIQSQKPHLEEAETDADLVNNPVDGQISRNFGKREHPITKEIKEHNGIDIKAPEGTDVVSSISGTVTEVDFDSEKGNYIVVENGNIKTLYAQLATTTVNKGDKITAKQSIGTVGKTGNATGAHLHFEVMVDGEYVDPAAYIK